MISWARTTLSTSVAAALVPFLLRVGDEEDAVDESDGEDANADDGQPPADAFEHDLGHSRSIAVTAKRGIVSRLQTS